MLEIQVVSDLHVEFWAKKQQFNFLKPSAPILALLGDICCCGYVDDFELFKRFILELMPLYTHIIFIAGNHEYYMQGPKKAITLLPEHTIAGIDKKIKQFFKETSPNLHYLNNKVLKLTDGKHTYSIIGSTLWTWFPEDMRKAAADTMNDYNYIYTADADSIRRFTPDDTAYLFTKNKKFLKAQIAKAKKRKHKIVVLTHHKPYTDKSDTRDVFNHAYESDLSELFDPQIVVWGYGHTHVADSTIQKGTWFYSNPKGYPSQKTKFLRATSISV